MDYYYYTNLWILVRMSAHGTHPYVWQVVVVLGTKPHAIIDESKFYRYQFADYFFCTLINFIFFVSLCRYLSAIACIKSSIN